MRYLNCKKKSVTAMTQCQIVMEKHALLTMNLTMIFVVAGIPLTSLPQTHVVNVVAAL